MTMVYQWLSAALVLLIPALAGASLLASFNVIREKVSLSIIGTLLGISAYGTITYVIGHIIPLSAQLILIELIFFGLVAFIALFHSGWKRFLSLKLDTIALAIFCVSILLFAIIGNKLLIEKPDGIYTGIINAYGDIGWHGSIITNIAEHPLLPLENPIFAGEKLTYPFLANLMSSTMVILGSSLAISVNLPAIIFIPLLLSLLYLVIKEYSESKAAAVIACILFLFGGATFGWLQFIQDISHTTGSFFEFISALPAEDYSGVGTSTKGFHFLNPVTSLLLPQRAMLFGIPLVLSILLLIHPNNIHKRNAAIVAGVLAGMLPLFHAHACIALAVAGIAMIIAYPHRNHWIPFFIPALAIGLPELLFYMNGSAESGSFFRYGTGWMAGTRNQIVYWFQNTGIYIPLSLLGLLFKAPKASKVLALAGTVLFIVADTFLFAPWAWDNFKLFVFWFLFILPLVSWYLAQGLKKGSHPGIRIIVLLIIFIHVFAGLLDVYKLALPTAREWEEWDITAVHIAEQIKTFVPTGSPILTAPVHNSPAVLAGRTLFLGYAAHIWSHGGNPWDREKAIKRYFEGEGDLIDGQKPQYILVGPQERSLTPNLFIRPSWKVLVSQDGFTLYLNN